MVTAPVQKSVINDAGIAFTGHTEYLAAQRSAHREARDAAGRRRCAARRAGDDAPAAARGAGAITATASSTTLAVLDARPADALRLAAPRILVCGLNPHAGESGHLGREEIEVIAPAHRRGARARHRRRRPAARRHAVHAAPARGADAVLAMYHDQGLPVLKHAGFGHAVNVTLGLPIVRTSVDHGTALDLAGTGRADPGSLFAAVELAARLAGG
jgi:4-hydroxythreonine-4-phosphate dehydrogenase